MTADHEGFFDNYQDRGMKKWAGFYLSEHTAIMEKLKLKEIQLMPQKEQLSAHAISQVIEIALLKKLPICLQKEEVDQDGLYAPDIVGLIDGYDTLGIYIDKQKVDYDSIRHIELTDFQKWHDIQN